MHSRSGASLTSSSGCAARRRDSTSARGCYKQKYWRTPHGRCSIRENVGLLSDLEPLWLRRAQQIFAAEAELAATYLANRRTHEANHNARDSNDLLADFREQRGRLVHLLSTADESTTARAAVHSRLQAPMRLVDLALFIAELDDHHLVAITDLVEECA